ncbi:MAG: RDD family protein [Rubrivivax sp.]|nr:RDD family protein [Rubrivivax sp.]
MNLQAPPSGGFAAPGIARRLACFVYEGVLLFGVITVAGLIYGLVTQQRHALVGLHGLQAFLFIVIGLYFVHFWTRSGQTLAMQTWHIRLITTEGGPVGRGRAALRYVLAWMWFLPALGAVALSGLKGSLPAFGALLSGVLVYAALARLHPERQFWHDVICGTRLVTWRPPPRK